MNDIVPIICYIHVCQKGLWEKIYDKIIRKIKCSGLYNACREIRIGIVNDSEILTNSNKFDDDKIKIITVQNSAKYERATLLHMSESSEKEDCQYFYCHTKGITRIGCNDKKMERCVKDWINLMLYWNVSNWKLASKKLMKNDIYGCEYSNTPVNHFSGNFWWANSQYIRTLPKTIGNDYTDPEFWIFKRSSMPLYCNIFSSGIDGGEHYFKRFIKGIDYAKNTS